MSFLRNGTVLYLDAPSPSLEPFDLSKRKEDGVWTASKSSSIENKFLLPVVGRVRVR
jgi:hypothetical protein